jgi:hypothetical protein
MDEKRKTGERRLNTPNQERPFYCTRQLTDRRRRRRPMPEKHWSEHDIDLITHCLTDNMVTNLGSVSDARSRERPTSPPRDTGYAYPRNDNAAAPSQSQKAG